MREEILQALKNHAEAHIEKHRLNVEVYLKNPVGVGDHPNITETIEHELNKIAEYHDQLEVLNTYF